MPMRSKIPERKGRDSFIMAKDDIQLLYEYDRWANNRVLPAVSPRSARSNSLVIWVAAFVRYETCGFR